MSKYSYTWLGRQYKWLKYTPFANTPLGSLLLRNYSDGSTGLSTIMDGLGNPLASIGKGTENGFGYFKDILSNLGNALNQLLTGDSLANLIKSLTHSGITDEARETMDLQLENQQLLNEQEYDRKIDFYERFESPQAQVSQYKAAGLNPMLLAGSGAGASASGGVGSAGSAGTAGASGGNLFSAIASIAGVMNQQKQLMIQQQDADTRAYEAETRRNQSIDYMAYLRSLTRKTDVESSQLEEMFPLKKENLIQQTNKLLEDVQSEPVRRALMQSGIDLNTAEKALKYRQAAILAAQEKFSDRYFKAVSELTEAQARLAEVQNEFERRTLEKRVTGLEAEVNDMIITAGIDGKVFENFGPAQARSWLETAAKVIGGAGAVLYGVSRFRVGASPGYTNAGFSAPTIM